ncbi:MAG: hypothetical protein U5S82_18635 [Gammaproteobacteria bacterium]|nr:hypothetical protein [Gammaproteobacteria bacterium]
MKNPITILNNIQLGKPNNLLVLHHDGYTLEGAVVHAGLMDQEVQASGASRALDWVTAVGEVLERIRSAGVKKPPRKAILVSGSALSALLDLPVNPERPRPPEQMRELVRWELEPLFAQHHERWCIGSLLMGRGYLTQQQRAEVMREALARNAASNNRLTVRFGEVAQNLGHVKRAHIDEGLALQEKLVQLDDEVFCGWAAQRMPEDFEIDDEAPRYPWLASGIGDGLRRQWVKACQRNKLYLTAIYPALGCGFGTLEHTENREELYIDVHQEQVAVLRGLPGALRAYRVENTHDGAPAPEQIAGLCQEELRPDIGRVLLNAPPATFETLAPLLAERLDRSVVNPVEAHGPQDKAA